jgi:hypothetical protein
MNASPTCPYCNAVVPVPAGARDGQFLPCPRCGERFPYHGFSAAENGTPPAPGVEAPPPVPDEAMIDRVGEGLRRWSKGAVALLIVGVMVLMAGGGLALALLTQASRRSHDRPPPPEELPPRVRVVAPADLAGLGYLPPDTDLVAAVQVAAMLEEPAGQKFLQRFRPEALLRGQAAEGPALPGNLEEWTGLGPGDLDSLVAGLKVADKVLPPRFILVARARRAFDEQKVLSALRAEREPGSGRQLYRFHVERLGQKPVLWFADDRTLIVALTPEQLAEVPETPRTGPDHLPAPLQEAIRNRLGDGAQVWAAGHATDWEKTTVGFLLAIPRARQLLAPLEQIRTFAVGLRFGDGLSLNGAFQCGDAAAAQKLAERLAAPPGDENGTLLAPLAGSRARTRELAKTLRVAREGKDSRWVTVRAEAGPEAVKAVRPKDLTPPD